VRDEKKRIEEEKKRKAEEERKAKEADEQAKRDAEKKKLAMKEYFKMIHERGLAKYIGQPQHMKKALNRLQA
jgi:membrane protein involved in colicin uptake